MEINILREPCVSQTVDSNSCGANSIAYYLWETNKSKFVNDKKLVANIHKNIEVGPNLLGIPENYSSPAKMAEELKKNWQKPSIRFYREPLVPTHEGGRCLTK